MTPPDIRYFATSEVLIRSAADFLSAELTDALDQRGRASLMLSGGSSPEPVYRALSNAPVAWKGVGISLVDERWVPSGHKASNADFIQRCFADSPAAQAHFVPLYNGHATAGEGVEAAEQALASLAQPFDICVLGMGGDSHTASWFPGSHDLEEALSLDNPSTLMAVDADGCPGAGEITERITLTRSAIMKTRRAVLLLSNREKTETFQAAMSKSETDTPVKALASLGDRLTVFAMETPS